jgi:hypothetical protein
MEEGWGRRLGDLETDPAVGKAGYDPLTGLGLSLNHQHCKFVKKL